MEQLILSSNNDYSEFDNYLNSNNIENIFVVTSHYFDKLNIGLHIKSLSDKKITYFTDFKPNPTYESVVEGVNLFNKGKYDLLLAVGGGSAIDVAKCIKLYANMDSTKNYFEQKIIYNDIKFMAVPTTAGTGSEATRYAVIYYNGEKQSITDESIIPEVVLFDASTLLNLPMYQKKATMLDSLSHAIESLWSVNSNDESMDYSLRALKLILDNYHGYLNNDKEALNNMLLAANISGKAINITATTAGHAMCYKLTSLYNIAHGHAAALVNAVLIPFVLDNLGKCCDKRGPKHLELVLKLLSDTCNCDIRYFLINLLKELDMYDIVIDNYDVDILVKSVNVTRLKNFPIVLASSDIRLLYEEIFDNINGGKNGS